MNLHQACKDIRKRHRSKDLLVEIVEPIAILYKSHNQNLATANRNLKTAKIKNLKFC